MSWAEIKKAINSNISKSLDVLIIEKSNEILTKLNSVYNTVTVKGNIPSVKSVQRGKVNYEPNVTTLNDGFHIIEPYKAYKTFYYDFTINSVNINKSIVILNGRSISLITFTSTNFSVRSGYEFSWQVIEFY